MISLHVDDFTISSDLQTTLDGIGKALAGKFEMTVESCFGSQD